MQVRAGLRVSGDKYRFANKGKKADEDFRRMHFDVPAKRMQIRPRNAFGLPGINGRADGDAELLRGLFELSIAPRSERENAMCVGLIRWFLGRMQGYGRELCRSFQVGPCQSESVGECQSVAETKLVPARKCL